MRDWKNMPGPGDEETWGPCTGQANDPRTEDGTDRFEEVEREMIERRMADPEQFQQALVEASEEQIKAIMALVSSPGDDNLGGTIYGIVFEHVKPTEWEVGEQIELENHDGR